LGLLMTTHVCRGGHRAGRWLSALVLAAAAACAAAPNGGAATEADGPTVAGEIAAVEAGPTLRLTVETDAVGEERGRTVVLLVEPGTPVLVRHPDGREARGDARDLTPGSRVRAELTGTELRSLSPQYPVSRIWVLR
jgi:hypothetical protein